MQLCHLNSILILPWQQWQIVFAERVGTDVGVTLQSGPALPRCVCVCARLRSRERVSHQMQQRASGRSQSVGIHSLLQESQHWKRAKIHRLALDAPRQRGSR